jgi:hypothetical protein
VLAWAITDGLAVLGDHALGPPLPTRHRVIERHHLACL